MGRRSLRPDVQTRRRRTSISRSEQISYSAKRDEAVDFSDSYYDVQQALVAAKGSPISRRDDASADLAGTTIAAPIGTTSYDCIVANIPDATAGVLHDALATPSQH